MVLPSGDSASSKTSLPARDQGAMGLPVFTSQISFASNHPVIYSLAPSAVNRNGQTPTILLAKRLTVSPVVWSSSAICSVCENDTATTLPSGLKSAAGYAPAPALLVSPFRSQTCFPV